MTNEAKRHFEANMLDGEKIEDCGSAMLSAESVWEYLEDHDQQIALDADYLSHFSYVDWEVGDDDKLRLCDYINCNHQRPHDGYEQNFEGQIVAHHTNGLPVVIYNVDSKEPDNSGDYADLQGLMMDGWEFSRLATLKAKEKK